MSSSRAEILGKIKLSLNRPALPHRHGHSNIVEGSERLFRSASSRDNLVGKFCAEFELVSTESVRAGALNELYYTAQLRKGKKASELIAALSAVNTGQRVTVLTGYDQTDI